MEINDKKNQPPSLPARKSKHSIGASNKGDNQREGTINLSKKDPPPLPPRKIRDTNGNEKIMNRNSKRRSSKRRSLTSSHRNSKGIHIAVTTSITSSASSVSSSDAIEFMSQSLVKNENQLVSTPTVEKKHPVLRIADAELAMMAMEDPMTPSQLESSFQDNVIGTPNVQQQQSAQTPAINLSETKNANSTTAPATNGATGSWWKSASSNEKQSFAKWVGDKLSKRHDIPKIVKASFWMQQKSQTSKILLTPEPVVNMKLFETVPIDNDMSENIPDNQLSSATTSTSKLEKKLSKKLSDNGLGRSPKLSGAQKQILIESLGYSSKQIKIVSPHTPIDTNATNLGERGARRQATPVLLQANFRELSIHDSSTPNKLKN